MSVEVEELLAWARRGGRYLRSILPRRLGFVVVVFEHGGPQRVVHVSSCESRLLDGVLHEVRQQLRRRGGLNDV